MNLEHFKLQALKPQPVDSIENLKFRVERFFRAPSRRAGRSLSLSLDLSQTMRPELEIEHPSKSVANFLNFLTDALPDGDVYLFGGILRDLALHGQRGFNSDIDLVVEGNWPNCADYLRKLGAQNNKFGGYRLTVAGWPIDIWNAKETWAIREGLVRYHGISSLTETTVLNWDAILMNWRTKVFVHRRTYIEALRKRILDVVLQQNPNPLGMAVRVFRHLCLKDAMQITTSAAEYMAKCAHTYSYQELQSAELRSYGNAAIPVPVYRFFAHLNLSHDELDLQGRFNIASDVLAKELGLA
jgi:predicted nucleotidyltransferase